MNIVITGSSRGIGKALAKEFLNQGDSVIISSRFLDHVNNTVNEFGQLFPESVFGHPCDVTEFEELQKLVEFCLSKFEKIDIWINNAGTTGFEHNKFNDILPKTIETVISTNVMGTMLGCKAILPEMLSKGQGMIFNMNGFGSDGRKRVGMTTYGTSKRSIPYFTNSLAKEYEETNLGIHSISPGMVVTDLLTRNANKEAKKVFNILAELPATVAEYLVPRIKTIKGTGKEIRYLTKLKVIWRFLTAWRRKNRFFNEEGELSVELDN